MKRIYADANATYPVAPEHYDHVAAILKEMDGNPSSVHAHGRHAKVALERARSSLATLLGARGPELIFTSGATEANNLALHGVVERERQTAAARNRPKILLSAAEHSSLLEPAQLLAARGLCTLGLIPVNANGRVEIETLRAALDDDVIFVGIMHGNNEIGSLNSVKELAQLVRQRLPRAHMHVDAAQTLGKEDLRWVAASTIDSLALSAHKIGGFKGVGALYLRNGAKLALLMAGGGQERGRRPGTENMPGIVSFGLRCDEWQKNRDTWVRQLRQQQSDLLDQLRQVPGMVIHGAPQETESSLANTINFHVNGMPGEDILLNFDLAGIAASSGSACSSGVARPSHVLKAMGYDDWTALNSVRLSFSVSSNTAATPANDGAQIVQTLHMIIKRRQ